MKASHAAMLLLACHSGNVIAAPAAHGNGLTSGSKTERNAPPFKFTNNLLDARHASCKEESSFGTLRQEPVEEKTGSETTTLGLHPEQCKAMILANSMLTSAFEFLHRVPQAHDKHAPDNIHPRDLLRREEAMHRAVQQAAREAEGLGLERNLVTTMFKTLNDAKHSSHPLHGNSRSSLSFVLKSFFDALKAFFAELKAAESHRHYRPGLSSATQSTDLPTLASQGSDLATPTPQGSGLPDPESPDDPELPPTDSVPPEPIPFVVDDPYGGDRYGGDRYGGDRYGGDRYGGDRYGDNYGGDRYGHYGGDSYGGSSYGGSSYGGRPSGGDHYHGSDSSGDDHYPGADPFWNDPNESSSASLSSSSLPTDVTTGDLPTGRVHSEFPSGLFTSEVPPISSLPASETSGALAIETTPTSYYQSGVSTDIDSSQLPTGLPSGFIPTGLLPSGIISSLFPSGLPTGFPIGLIPTSLLSSGGAPLGLPTDIPSGLFPTSLLPSSLIPTDLPSGLTSGLIPTSLLPSGVIPTGLSTDVPSPPDYGGGDAGEGHTSFGDYGQAPSDSPTGFTSGLIPTSVLPSSLIPTDLPSGLPSGLIPTSLLPSGVIPTGLSTDVPSPPDYGGGDAGESPTSFADYGQAPSDSPTGLPSGLIPTSLLPSGVIPTDLPTGLPSGLITTGVLPSDVIRSLFPSGPSGLSSGLPSGLLPTSLLPSGVIPTDLPTDIPSGLIPTSLLPSGLISSVFPTGLPSGLIPTSLPSGAISSKLSTAPGVIPTGIPTAVPPGFIPTALLPASVIPSRIPTGLPSGLIPATLLPSGYTPSYTIPTTGIWTGLVPTAPFETDAPDILPPAFTNTRTDIFHDLPDLENPFPDGLPSDLFPHAKRSHPAAHQATGPPVSSLSGGALPTGAPIAGGVPA
ncbi:hypothetical protein E4U32_008183 [Claviceps aff. humidiphila group G2b]|nr:hypothetical protein E4U32_008183 [Claviceps aff. humidiphila group G2b]